ncbi:MAG: hypothetical protein ACXWCM_04470 [Acidimicrobiales bacterium]
MSVDDPTRPRWAAVGDRLAEWDRRSLVASVAFALVGGLTYCILLGDKIRFPDESDYLRLSQHVADTGSYSFDGVHATAFRPPGYGYFLAGLRLIGMPVIGLRWANFVCLALMVWAAWWLARRVAGPVAATLAAPVVALYPLGFYTAGAFYPQVLGGALVLGGLVALVQIPGARHPYWLAAAAGLAFGALLVTIPPLATALLVGVVWLAFTDRRVRTVLLVLGLAALIPLSWTARNLVVMHQPVLGSTNNGLNLLIGNSPDAAPRKGVATDVTPYEHAADDLGYTDDPEHEVQRDAYLRDQAVEWIRSNPGDAAVLFVGKTVNYFAPFDQLGTASENSAGQQALATLTYLPLLALFIVRLFRWRRERPGETERLLIFLYVLAAPAQAVFVTRVRYRVPLEPLLIIVVAGLIARWVERQAITVAAPRPTPQSADDAEPVLEPTG